MSLLSDDNSQEKGTRCWKYTNQLDAQEGRSPQTFLSTPGEISSPLCHTTQLSFTQPWIETDKKQTVSAAKTTRDVPIYVQQTAQHVITPSENSQKPQFCSNLSQECQTGVAEPETVRTAIGPSGCGPAEQVPSVSGEVNTGSEAASPSAKCAKLIVLPRATTSPGQSSAYLKKNVLYTLRPSSQSDTNKQMFAIWNGRSFVEVTGNNKDGHLTVAVEGSGCVNSVSTSTGVQLPVQANNILTTGPSIRTLPNANNASLMKYQGIISALQRENSRSSKVANGLSGGSEALHSDSGSNASVAMTMKTSAGSTTDRVSDKVSSQTGINISEMPTETLAEDEFKLCKNCGALTKSVRSCESCNRAITASDKTVRREIHPETLVKTNPSTGSDQSLISKQNFYGQLFTEHWKPYAGSAMQRGKSCGGGVPSNNFNRRSDGKRGKITKKLSRGKAKLEPETVTLSSDEEEKAGDQSKTSVVSNCSVNSSPTSSATCGMSNSAENMDIDKSHNVKTELSTSSEANDGSLSQPVSHGPWDTILDSNCSGGKTKTGTRRDRMEDAAGHVPTKSRKTKHRRPEDDDNWLFTDPSITLNVRCIRIGILKGVPVEPVFLSKDGFFIKMKCEKGTCEVWINPADIQNVAFHLQNRMPVIYMNVSNGCGHRLQRELKTCSAEEVFFDPTSSDMTLRFVTMLLERATDKNDHKTLMSLLHHFERLKPHRGQFIQTLTCDEAQTVLIRTTRQTSVKLPSVAAAPTTPKAKDGHAEEAAGENCVGSVEKLVTYRPVAEKGGISISTEDLLCLREGEFLNDVIIDFYLKYLMNEVLSVENRNRTYVFSSFFYKRLTQRQGRSSPDDHQQADLKIRRHDQVKTWTRHVDLFSKDFIIVPINEHSHWFLAIICFPGLLPVLKNRPQKTVTSTSALSEASPQTEQMEASEDWNENSSSENPSPISSSFAQPCILVFDSLAGTARTSVVKTLREYLCVEWSVKKQSSRTFDRDTVRGGYPKVPQQNNFSDCGVYVLQFVESFFQKPITDFSIPIRGLQDWFTEEEVSKKRGELRNLILSLHQKSKLQSKLP